MAYVSSNKIRVFPSVGRSNYDIESQLMNENNISQIVRSLCRSRKNYVLSTEFNTGPFEFVIYGFYFKILDASTTLSSITSDEGTTEVWAGIKIDADAEANNQSSNYQLLQLANTAAQNNEIIDLDREDKFQGIIFGSTENEVKAEGENYHTLRLLVKDGDTFKIPAKSLLHLNTTEILDGDSSDYISDNFTTKTLTTSTLNVKGLTTLSGDLSSDSKITTTSEFEGALSGSWIKNSSITTNKLGFELSVYVDPIAPTLRGDHCTLVIKAPAIYTAEEVDKEIKVDKIK